ncbi:MAG: response regulator transcription factor [Cyanobacteriota bacterium]|nr:response regulator transcription factor [Cyanobacteriota bacterium]
MNIWILDDDEAMVSLLSRQSQKLNWNVQALNHPRQLPQALRKGHPDVLVLDQLLPEKHGLDVLASLQQAGRAFPVLILSALGAPSDRIAGLEAGADDYLSKPFHFRELQLRVERLLRTPYANGHAERSPSLPAGTFQLANLRFEASPQPRLISNDRGVQRLSRGECALLHAFCRSQGTPLSRAQLLQATGSLVAPGQTRTIDVRVSRLRRVLRDLAGEELIQPERGMGYRLVADVRELADGQPQITPT